MVVGEYFARKSKVKSEFSRIESQMLFHTSGIKCNVDKLLVIMLRYFSAGMSWLVSESNLKRKNLKMKNKISQESHSVCM